MLYVGSDDGVYRFQSVPSVDESAQARPTVDRVLEAERPYRLRQFEELPGLFATAESGLYHSPDGADWTRIPVPEEQVYAVTADPSGSRLYAGTRPARVFVADAVDGLPGAAADWTECESFAEFGEEQDWGIPRHDGISQVRSLATHPAVPERVIAGVEVGGVIVSPDGGETWTDRRIGGVEAPHTDDIHHLAHPDADTIVASTGSGLYRSTDVGRTWERLDAGHDQRYFREAFVHDDVVYAGGAPASSASWAEDEDHALFEGRDGDGLAAVQSPRPEEVAIGWCVADGTILAVTHGGGVLARGDDGWREVGTVPTPGAVRGRYLPMIWVEE